MGAQPAPVRQHFAAIARSGAPDAPRETERVDPTDTGVMARRLLAPYVSEEEEGEYQRFFSFLCLTHFFPFQHAIIEKKKQPVFFFFRYIDQIGGLMDGDELGPGPGDLDMYERAVSFLSGNVEPTSDLDDVSLAYVQIPQLAMESEYFLP